MLTMITMTLLIVWAIRNICRDLGITDVARDKIKDKYGKKD